MPREKIQDPTTPRLYTQVSWRRHDEIPDFDAPGHVQVATINEDAANLVADLLGSAWGLIANAGWNAATGDVDLAKTEGWHAAAIDWRDEYHAHMAELTGWYASHDPTSLDYLIKALHKAKRQAFPPNEVPHRDGEVCEHNPDGGNRPVVSP
jgi:hypothetical protein